MAPTPENLERAIGTALRTAVDRHWDTLIMVELATMTIVYANEGACHTLGYLPGELIGKSPALVFAHGDEARLREEYGTLSRSPDWSQLGRNEFRRKDGTTVPVEVAREYLHSGSREYVLGVARDLTERLAAERALRESEARLALALEGSGLALFDWDLKTGLVHLGKEWESLMGGEPRPTAMPIHELENLVHPDDLPGLRERLRKLLTGEIDRYRIEHRVRLPDGRFKWIESIAEVSERDEAGRAVRITGTNADIDERKTLADLKNAFVATVSHELRTPLSSIVASIELMLAGAAGELPPRARELLQTAHGNGERLAAIIGDILGLERIESGRMKLAITAVGVAGVLEQAARLNAGYAARHRATIAATPVAEGLTVLADRSRLLQVLANLVSNAAKFSPEGGEVAIAAEPAGRRVRFRVADRGPGIPAAFQPRIFGKFEQADGSRGGTGLGLAITKAMVEMMGGEIGFRTGPQGTTFEFELPAA